MSLEVKSNKELKKIKSELFYGMGVREIVIISVTAVFVGFLFAKLKINAMILCYLTAPVIAAATMLLVVRPCGMMPEQFVLVMLRAVFINRREYTFKKNERGAISNVIKNHRKAGLHETEDSK